MRANDANVIAAISKDSAGVGNKKMKASACIAPLHNTVAKAADPLRGLGAFLSKGTVAVAQRSAIRPHPPFEGDDPLLYGLGQWWHSTGGCDSPGGPAMAEDDKNDLEEGCRATQEIARKQDENFKAVAEATKPIADAAAQSARDAVLAMKNDSLGNQLGTKLPEIEEARRRYSPNYWINRMDREDRERTDRKHTAIEQSERPSERPVSSGPMESPIHAPSSGVWEHLHLPKTPAEATAALAWTVLVLAFGFLFVESLGELLPSPAWRAALGFAGMVGVTVMLIYRAWLLERFRNISGGSIIAAVGTLLIVVALSPYAEQHWWPYIERKAASVAVAPSVQERSFGFAESTHRAPPQPLTKEAQELRGKEYVELYDFLGATGAKAVALGLKVPMRYDPADKTERLRQVVRYYDAVNATFNGLTSIVQKYPFSDVAAEFTSSQRIGAVKQAVLSPIPDCLDLLDAMPEPPPVKLLNYFKSKLGTLGSTSLTLRDWVQSERQSLAGRIQGSQ